LLGAASAHLLDALKSPGVGVIRRLTGIGAVRDTKAACSSRGG